MSVYADNSVDDATDVAEDRGTIDQSGAVLSNSSRHRLRTGANPAPRR
jgi:hypothetical protein